VKRYFLAFLILMMGVGSIDCYSQPSDSSDKSLTDLMYQERYIDNLFKLLRSNIAFDPSGIVGNPQTIVSVEVNDDGVIVKSLLIKSSGYLDWDNAVLSGIAKTERFQKLSNGQVPIKTWKLTLKPKS
jgi:hypothetical protein